MELPHLLGEVVMLALNGQWIVGAVVKQEGNVLELEPPVILSAEKHVRNMLLPMVVRVLRVVRWDAIGPVPEGSLLHRDYWSEAERIRRRREGRKPGDGDAVQVPDIPEGG